MTNKIFLLVIIIMLGGLLYLEIVRPAQKITWSPDKQREYANKLKAEGLNKEAIAEYEKYLAMQNVDKETQSNIYYNIGKIAEESGDYEQALAFFYRVELVNPDINIKQELGEHIVACLEKMGRGIDAQNALEKRTALEQKPEAGGKVIARIGKEYITDTQLNGELEKLPEWMREEYSKPDKKIEFLKQYLAMELLHRKAKRLGFDKDLDIRQKLDGVLKELMVQKLLEKEIAEKVKITPNEVELYYKANKDKYINEETKTESPLSEVKDRVSYEYQMERQKLAYQELLEETLKAEDVEIYE